MKKIYQLGVILTLASLSAISLAANCDSLVNLGAQKSVIPHSGGINITDVDNCSAQCDSYEHSGNPLVDAQNTSRCISSLSTLAFAVNFDDSLSGLSPQSYASGSGLSSLGGANPLSSAAASTSNTHAHANTQVSAPGFKQTSAHSSTNTYIMNPGVVSKISNANNQQHSVRWY